MRQRNIILALLALLLGAGLALAQRPPRKPRSNNPPIYEAPKNEEDLSGRTTFARIRFDVSLYSGYRMALGDGGPPWSHDYPIGGQHLMKIITEISKIDATLDRPEPIFTFDDPMLNKYPFVYLCEVGYMNLNEREIAGLREYCLRGGFVMVDDFRSPEQLENLHRQVRAAFPEYELKRLDQSHPIFNCFFSIKSLDLRPMYGPLTPEFYGLEDSTGRLMMAVNYNYDMSDWWQWSDNPFRPIEETNESYKFGVNYIMYALTH